jgi:hypothetical protein
MFCGMKLLCLKATFLLLAGICLSCCETTSETTSDSPLKTSGSVPGEKTSDEPVSATAGPGGAGAGVKW